MTNRDHIIEEPKWIWIIRIVQAVLAVIILGFSAYGVHFFAFNAYCLSLFTALWTLLVLTYIFVSFHSYTVAYHSIAVLVLEALTAIFWLCSWATLAALYSAGVNLYKDYDYYYGYPYYKRSLVARDTTKLSTYRNVLITAIVFSLITFLLHVVTLVFFGLGFQKHRKSGNPMQASGTGTAAPATTSAAPANYEMEQAAAPVQHVQKEEV